MIVSVLVLGGVFLLVCCCWTVRRYRRAHHALASHNIVHDPRFGIPAPQRDEAA